jgi:hypothetical protein
MRPEGSPGRTSKCMTGKDTGEEMKVMPVSKYVSHLILTSGTKF